jgi:hypothetical protein
MSFQEAIPQAQLKKLKKKELLKTLKTFKSSFKKPRRRKVNISTPQADCGIGPIHYDVKVRRNMPLPVGQLRQLNKIVKSEKSMGDKLIKFDASLLFLAAGKEDPKGFLPPGCRAAIRTEIQESAEGSEAHFKEPCS